MRRGAFSVPRSISSRIPYALAGMSEAVEAIAATVRAGRTILVHGDYDVDGQCATALLTRALRGGGADVVPFVPHRLRDGYDFGAAGLEAAQARRRLAHHHLRLRHHRGGNGASARGRRASTSSSRITTCPATSFRPRSRSSIPSARATPPARRRSAGRASRSSWCRRWCRRSACPPTCRSTCSTRGARHRGGRGAAGGREPDPGEARPAPPRREPLAGHPRAARGERARRDGSSGPGMSGSSSGPGSTRPAGSATLPTGSDFC